MWLIWQWLMLCKADVRPDYSFYGSLKEKFVCAMTCVWDAERSSPLCPIEMCVQTVVDLALILLRYNLNVYF